MRHLDNITLDQDHVARALLIARLSPCEELLAFDRVDHDTEPTAVFTDYADRDRSFVGGEAVIDNGYDGGLSGF